MLEAVDDKDHLVRSTAIESLGVIGDSEVLRRLMPRAMRPPDQGVGIAAAHAVKLLAKRLGVEVDTSRIRWWRHA